MVFDAANLKNCDIVRYLRKTDDCSPENVASPYLMLGTHPDLVERLWDKLTATLPTDCRWVVGNRPVLVRKDSGIAFGVAVGTAFYALRLPQSSRVELQEAKRALVERWATEHGLSGDDRQHYLAVQLKECPVGPEWISGIWLAEEIELCVRAYHWAA